MSGSQRYPIYDPIRGKYYRVTAQGAKVYEGSEEYTPYQPQGGASSGYPGGQDSGGRYDSSLPQGGASSGYPGGQQSGSMHDYYTPHNPQSTTPQSYLPAPPEQLPSKRASSSRPEDPPSDPQHSARGRRSPSKSHSSRTRRSSRGHGSSSKHSKPSIQTDVSSSNIPTTSIAKRTPVPDRSLPEPLPLPTDEQSKKAMINFLTNPHFKIDSVGRLQCSYCPRKFDNTHGLEIHQKLPACNPEIHGHRTYEKLEEGFRCMICGELIKGSPRDLHQHQRSCHADGIRSKPEPKKQKPESKRSEPRTSMRITHPDQMSPEDLDRLFTDFVLHPNYVVQDDGLLKCSYCESKRSSIREICFHQREGSGCDPATRGQNYIGTIKREGQQDRWYCKFCDNSFSFRFKVPALEHLEIHRPEVTSTVSAPIAPAAPPLPPNPPQEYRYFCNECQPPSTFVSQEELDYHIEIYH